MDIGIKQGATFDNTLVWTKDGSAVQLDGYTARLQVRATLNSTATLLELTTENGGIVLTAATGEIQLVITAVATAAFTWTAGTYDLEMITSTGKVRRLLEGKVKVSKEVTR